MGIHLHARALVTSEIWRLAYQMNLKYSVNRLAYVHVCLYIQITYYSYKSIFLLVDTFEIRLFFISFGTILIINEQNIAWNLQSNSFRFVLNLRKSQ